MISISVISFASGRLISFLAPQAVNAKTKMKAKAIPIYFFMFVLHKFTAVYAIIVIPENENCLA